MVIFKKILKNPFVGLANLFFVARWQKFAIKKNPGSQLIINRERASPSCGRKLSHPWPL